MLRCRGLVYVYPDGTKAIGGIDLDVEAGELFCLLGPNGAGKTTLIRQITTELRPTRGQVELFGLDAHKHSEQVKLRIGVIPQSVGLFEALRTREHLTLFGPLKGLSRAATREAVEQVLDECGLADLGDKRVRELSGGQQRRLLVALALLADPELLILDEPTVGLDPVARRSLWRTIRAQRESGKAIVLTTHYMDEAEHVADRIGFIQHGSLCHVGTLKELYEQLGKSVRVTQTDPEEGTPLGQYYFDSLPEAQAHVREAGFEAYSVGRVSLEDIYLRVMEKHSPVDKAGDGRGS